MSIVPDILGDYIEYHVPDGALGSDIRHNVAQSGRWLINSVYFDLSCDATAGGRYPHLRFTPTTFPIFISGTHAKGAGPNNYIHFTCYHGATVFIDPIITDNAYIQLPRIPQISGTFEFSINVDGIKPGDQILNIYFFASFWQEH